MSKIKTLFIGLPSEENYSNLSPPIGLCYLSAVLKKTGYRAKMIDCSLCSWKQIKDLLRKEKPHLLGIQVLTIERSQSYKLAKIAKKILHKIKIVFGGQHASFFPTYMFKLAPVDFVVVGEGEETIVELVSALQNKTPLKGIKGLVYRDKNKIVLNAPRMLIHDLDTIPFPDFSTIDEKDYILGGFSDLSIPIFTSRGCPYTCTFCSSTFFWKHKFRARSANNVLNEIEGLYNKRGITNFAFYDDNFIVNKRRLIEICKGILERKLKIRFSVCSSVRIIDDERLHWLKKAGCFSIGYGVESGSVKILKAINKQQTPKEIERAFTLARKYGLECGGSLIVGCPGETKKTLKATAKLMNKVMPSRLSYAGILWILPGTPIYELSKKKGIVSDKTWLKTNKEIFYTAEHSLRELRHLQKLLLYYQARERDFKQQLRFVIWYIFLSLPFQSLLRKIYYGFFRFKLGWNV